MRSLIWTSIVVINEKYHFCFLCLVSFFMWTGSVIYIFQNRTTSIKRLIRCTLSLNWYEPKRQETTLRTCALSEDSDQTAYSRSLIRIFTGRDLDSQECNVSTCGQQRLWPDCADVQADLSLRWAHMSEGTLPDVATRIVMGVLFGTKHLQNSFRIIGRLHLRVWADKRSFISCDLNCNVYTYIMQVMAYPRLGDQQRTGGRKQTAWT